MATANRNRSSNLLRVKKGGAIPWGHAVRYATASKTKTAIYLSRSWYTAATISNFLSPTPWYVALSPYVSPPNHWCTSLSDLPSLPCVWRCWRARQRWAKTASCHGVMTAREGGEALYNRVNSRSKTRPQTCFERFEVGDGREHQRVQRCT